MFLFNSYKLHKKTQKLSQFSYDNLPEWTLEGKEFYSKILDIYDGDTITISIKINEQYHRMNCRLLNIDTPELRSSDENEKNAAKLARNHLIFLLTKQKVNSEITRNAIRNICNEFNPIFLIQCNKFDKYGRLLITILTSGTSINEKMIEDGFAGKYDGKTKAEWQTYFKH